MTSTVSGVRPTYSPSVQTGWSGSVSIVIVRHCRWNFVERHGQVQETDRGRGDGRVVMLVDPEAVEQPVIDGVRVGDLEPGPHHPGVDDIDLRGVEVDGLAVQLGVVVDGLAVSTRAERHSPGTRRPRTGP